MSRDLVAKIRKRLMEKFNRFDSVENLKQHGNLASREYLHTLRLTSELVDLRVGYANTIPHRFACGVCSPHR